MKYFVAIIHNNSLGRSFFVQSEEEGKDFIRGMAEEKFGRALTDEEIDMINDSLEIYNEDDADNIYCFSIGILEELISE